MLLKSWVTTASLVVICWFFSAVQESRADLVVRGYDTNLHDRFSNSPQFIGNPYDWSGVARSSGGRWATMISANYFLSAVHFAPSIGDTLTIYGTNSTSGPQQVVNIVGGQQIAGSDLWLGRIDTPTNFATYSVIAPTDLTGQTVYMLGVASGFPTEAQMRFGRNTVEAFFPNFSDPNLGATVGDIYIYDYDTPTGGVGPDEAMVQGGDSGAPTFLIVNNKPAIMGFHWFQYTGDFGDASAGSGDTAMSGYINAVNQAMVGQQLSIVTVPEPGSMALVGLPLAAWGLRRYRRQPRPKTVV